MAPSLSSKAVCLLSLLSSSAFGLVPQPLEARQTPKTTLKITANIPENIQPVVNVSFPDPAIIQGPKGKWWAYATAKAAPGPRVQMASADSPLGPWTFLDTDAKPELAWTDTTNTWAPDVQRISDESYVLYYSAPPSGGGQQCLGAARASAPAGPFKPDPEPLMCRNAAGGVIDVSGFLDLATGQRYIVYKLEAQFEVDGKNYTNPQFIREVDAKDGTTFKGEEVMINYRQEGDGFLVEAPQVISRKGKYVLFFSSQVFDSEKYDTQYAVADSVLGPYIRRGQVIGAPMGGLWGPGGAQSVQDPKHDVFLFHGWCNNNAYRCMYAADYTVEEVPA